MKLTAGIPANDNKLDEIRVENLYPIKNDDVSPGNDHYIPKPKRECANKRRSTLVKLKKRFSMYSLVSAVVGLCLALIENQLTAAKIIAKTSYCSLVIKIAISLSTILLIGEIIAYHIYDLQLIAVENHKNNWKLGITCQRLVKILIEFTVCVIHPFPLPLTLANSEINLKFSKLPVDVILCIPMPPRLYLIWRVLLLHSKFFSDASVRRVGASYLQTCNN